MRTVLCNTTSGRGRLLPVLVAGVVGGSILGGAFAPSASAAVAGRAAHHRPHHAVATATGSGVALGPAVKYVLDTNVVVRLLAGDERVLAHLSDVDPSDVGIPLLVLAELLFGAEKSARVARKIGRASNV